MSKTFHWTGFASARYGEALFSVANTGERNQRLVVQRFDVQPLTMSGTFFNPNTVCPFMLSYINGMASGGGVPVAAVPHVPGTTLPSQVRLELLNPSVSLVSNTVIGKRLLAQWNSNAGTITGVESLVGVTPPDNWLYSCGYRDASTQGFVLPEGYGISICPGTLTLSGADSSVPQTIMFWGTVLFKDGAGNVFSAVFELTPGSRRFFGAAGVTPATVYDLFPPFTLFNGVGSGTTLTVLSVNWRYSVLESGTSPNRFDNCRVQFISTFGDNAVGETVTPVAAVPGDACSFLRVSRSRLGAATKVNRFMPDEAQANIGLNNSQYNPAITTLPGGYFFAARADGVYRMAQVNRVTGNTFAAEAPSMTKFGDRHQSPNTQGFVIPSGCGFACVPEVEMQRSFNVSDVQNSYHAYFVELVINVPDDGAVGFAYA